MIVYGTYDLLMPDSKEIYMYTRTLGEEKLLTVCNFSDQEIQVEVPAEFTGGTYMISNYEEQAVSEKMTLRAYEAFVIEK